MRDSRYHWVDHLKTLGIVLVVAGHTALPLPLHRWIYAFHMPLFFILSGFLISPGAFTVPLREFFLRRVWKLVKFYGWFGLLGMLVYCYIFRHERPLMVAVSERLYSLLYASASRDSPADLYPLVLWYFPGLISGLLITYAVWKIPCLWARAVTMTAVFTCGFLMDGWVLPWELESGCVAAGFLAIGHLARIESWDDKLQRTGRKALPVAAAAFLLGSHLALLNTHCLDVRLATLGNPLLALPACFLLFLALAIGSMHLPAWRISEAVAAATIVIFPTHPMLFPYVDRVAVKLGVLGPELATIPLWYALSKAVLVVTGTTLVYICYAKVKSHQAALRA